jgi:hypothetical protein
MTDEITGRVQRRAADLLPEERAVGSDDPQAQAEAILADSDRREGYLDVAPDSFVEHRTSADTVTPPDDTVPPVDGTDLR